MLHEAQNNARSHENGQDDDFWAGIAEGADMIPGSVPPGTQDTAAGLSLLNNGTTPFEANDPLTPAMLPVMPVPDADGAGEDENEVGAGADADEIETDTDIPGPDETDPLGSWTGVPTDGDEVPTQDADDL